MKLTSFIPPSFLFLSLINFNPFNIMNHLIPCFFDCRYTWQILNICRGLCFESCSLVIFNLIPKSLFSFFSARKNGGTWIVSCWCRNQNPNMFHKSHLIPLSLPITDSLSRPLHLQNCLSSKVSAICMLDPKSTCSALTSLRLHAVCWILWLHHLEK